MKKIALFIMTLTVCMSTGCTSLQNKRYEKQYFSLFDTVTTIVGYAQDEQQFNMQCEQLRSDLEEYHILYDIYTDYEGINTIKTINDEAGIQPVKVDQKILDLLLFSKEMYQLTDGKVNVAFGSVLSIWHDYRTNGLEDPSHAMLPPFELLEAADAHTNIDQMVIDEKNSTVFLKDSQMRLDVGAIAKGYALEQACKQAEQAGFTNALISVGGNVRAIGTKEGANQLWKVGVQNPDQTSEQKVIDTVELRDQSLVVSGDYQRFYTVDGKPYHHIIDPQTLMPSTYYQSVSILCKDSGYADALSTAVFNMPLQEGKALIESLAEVEAVWILPDGQMEYSLGFKTKPRK